MQTHIGKNEICSECNKWYKECLEYLSDLKDEVHKFNFSENYWATLTPQQLEIECAKLLQHMGYDAIITAASKDRAIDIIARKNGKTTLVQCIRSSNKARFNFVRELLGAIIIDKADNGLLICTGGFTDGAKQIACSNEIELWSFDDLVKLTFNSMDAAVF